MDRAAERLHERVEVHQVVREVVPPAGTDVRAPAEPALVGRHPALGAALGHAREREPLIEPAVEADDRHAGLSRELPHVDREPTHVERPAPRLAHRRLRRATRPDEHGNPRASAAAAVRTGSRRSWRGRVRGKPGRTCAPFGVAHVSRRVAGHGHPRFLVQWGPDGRGAFDPARRPEPRGRAFPRGTAHGVRLRRSCDGPAHRRLPRDEGRPSRRRARRRRGALDGSNGLELVRSLRKRGNRLPLLFLSDRWLDDRALPGADARPRAYGSCASPSPPTSCWSSSRWCSARSPTRGSSRSCRMSSIAKSMDARRAARRIQVERTRLESALGARVAELQTALDGTYDGRAVQTLLQQIRDASMTLGRTSIARLADQGVQAVAAGGGRGCRAANGALGRGGGDAAERSERARPRAASRRGRRERRPLRSRRAGAPARGSRSRRASRAPPVSSTPPPSMPRWSISGSGRSIRSTRRACSVRSRRRFRSCSSGPRPTSTRACRRSTRAARSCSSTPSPRPTSRPRSSASRPSAQRSSPTCCSSTRKGTFTTELSTGAPPVLRARRAGRPAPPLRSVVGAPAARPDRRERPRWLERVRYLPARARNERMAAPPDPPRPRGRAARGPHRFVRGRCRRTGSRARSSPRSCSRGSGRAPSASA